MYMPAAESLEEKTEGLEELLAEDIVNKEKLMQAVVESCIAFADNKANLRFGGEVNYEKLTNLIGLLCHLPALIINI